MMEKVPFNFDKGKPFYPLVVNYIALLHGVVELSMRGRIIELKGMPREAAEREIEKHPKYARLLDSSPIQFPDLALRSEFQDNSIKIKTDEIASEFARNFIHILPFTMRPAGSLLIVAYESTEQYHDNGPLWEFLRHCRNAAAHNGLFHFHKGEPRYSAKWGKFNIEATMQGTPLFGDKITSGLLGPGDPLRLLWDIEQAYPSMHA